MLQMNSIWLVVVSLLILVGGLEGKKKGKDGLFTSESLKCLVCQSLVEEIEFLISKVDNSNINLLIVEIILSLVDSFMQSRYH